MILKIFLSTHSVTLGFEFSSTTHLRIQTSYINCIHIVPATKGRLSQRSSCTYEVSWCLFQLYIISAEFPSKSHRTSHVMVQLSATNGTILKIRYWGTLNLKCFYHLSIIVPSCFHHFEFVPSSFHIFLPIGVTILTQLNGYPHFWTEPSIPCLSASTACFYTPQICFEVQSDSPHQALGKPQKLVFPSSEIIWIGKSEWTDAMWVSFPLPDYFHPRHDKKNTHTSCVPKNE